MLAICRGLQVVNVAHGGTLIQDLGTDDHRQKYHPVNLTPNSKVAQAIGANQANAVPIDLWKKNDAAKAAKGKGKGKKAAVK
jgi:gamma-glutamyl-gamma-aminobutyrate hydrolase PuuD